MLYWQLKPTPQTLQGFQYKESIWNYFCANKNECKPSSEQKQNCQNENKNFMPKMQQGFKKLTFFLNSFLSFTFSNNGLEFFQNFCLCCTNLCSPLLSLASEICTDSSMTRKSRLQWSEFWRVICRAAPK